ncbi:hypothetical protein ABTK02_21355, partial [Acinetobacter baumannii]
MRAAGIAILLSLATSGAAAQSPPAPPVDATPLGVVHLGGAGRAATAGDSASWVWSLPEYCMSY